MRVRFTFEIDEDAYQEVDPWDVAFCETKEELESEIVEWPQARWRVFVDAGDLSALWEKIEEIRAEIEDEGA